MYGNYACQNDLKSDVINIVELSPQCNAAKNNDIALKWSTHVSHMQFHKMYSKFWFNLFFYFLEVQDYWRAKSSEVVGVVARI